MKSDHNTRLPVDGESPPRFRTFGPFSALAVAWIVWIVLAVLLALAVFT